MYPVNPSAVNHIDWYRDAVFYQVSIKSFYDSTGDGVGDLPGLVQKLEYIESLGVSGILLLPFFPSPLRDDGFDVADFQNVHPQFGTLYDFDVFLEEAHRRGLRVVADFVVNHTSDQHPWFEAARLAPSGSRERSFYIWSDTDAAYKGVPILQEAETSNWAWDSVARAFYWHRFFSHEPDLNWEHPAVPAAVLEAMRFWLARGVDGLRLVGAAYLAEREGTSCEDLPETRRILAQLRDAIAVDYPDRVLIVDAPKAAGVEPHGAGAEGGPGLAFARDVSAHIFMAVRLEHRDPILQQVRRMTELRSGVRCMFALRDHDELPLGSLGEEERDYMYVAYGADPRTRLNVGIRRRLAPLLDNNRGRLELFWSLLLALPGVPTVYYGDEIGMGDNVYLGDRHGLRTPMQWSPDRNGGFSKANPSAVCLPPSLDPIYGYPSVNVESQERSPFSLSHWLRRLLALRKQHAVFGRGDFRVIPSTNPKTVAFLRSDGSTRIVCVANLSRSATVTQLDLHEFAGEYLPVEMLALSEFPPIGVDFYSITLGAYGFYWFSLEPLPEDDPRRVQFYSCFISYSSRDQAFAERLHRDLLDRGVRCWFAPHDIRGGQKLYQQIDSAIRSHDRLLLVLSRDSMGSRWVETEIARARHIEVTERRPVLFPIAIVDYETVRKWECFDADTGKDSAREIREYMIPDFSQWRDENKYQEALKGLLRSLRSGSARR